MKRVLNFMRNPKLAHILVGGGRHLSFSAEDLAGADIVLRNNILSNCNQSFHSLATLNSLHLTVIRLHKQLLIILWPVNCLGGL